MIWMLYISTSKWVLCTAFSGQNSVFHVFFTFCKSVEKLLHPNVGSHPNAGVGSCEINA